MKQRQAYEIVEEAEKTRKIFRNNGTPRYYYPIDRYEDLSEEQLHAMEMVNCHVANCFTIWHCECNDPECPHYDNDN